MRTRLAWVYFFYVDAHKHKHTHTHIYIKKIEMAIIHNCPFMLESLLLLFFSVAKSWLTKQLTQFAQSAGLTFDVFCNVFQCCFFFTSYVCSTYMYYKYIYRIFICSLYYSSSSNSNRGCLSNGVMVTALNWSNKIVHCTKTH